MTSVRALADTDPQRWHCATRHPFLTGARDGTLPPDAFDRWLEQDRHFVEHLARAWSRIAVTAPRDDLSLLADGISAFTAEMVWFEQLPTERHLDLRRPELPAAAAYNQWLLTVAAEAYPVALAAMWLVEAAYLEAWRSALPGAPAYRPFVEHWADDAFADFVDRLGRAADAALATATPAEIEAAERAVLTTADHEAAFWAMTFSG